jgi:hypothetical protein
MPAIAANILISRTCRSDDSGLQVFRATGAGRVGALRSGSELS